MTHEYELVPHAQYAGLHLFLVRMLSRTPHLHRDLELGLILEGNFTLRQGEKEEALTSGDMYLVNPLEVHEFRSNLRGGIILAIQTSFHLMNRFFAKPIHPRFIDCTFLRSQFMDSQFHQARFSELQNLCINLASEYLSNQPESSIRCFGFLSELLCFLLEELPYANVSEADYIPMEMKSERLSSILSYIDENYTRKLLLSEIADRENLSMTYLSHFLQESLGMSFQEYLKRKRLEDAMRQIQLTDHSMLDIALNSGFSDVRYMNRAFMEILEQTPAEYRQKDNKFHINKTSNDGTTEQILSSTAALSLIRNIRFA